jgi:hypothetical protein
VLRIRSLSGSRSFFHQAKIVRKSWFLLFCDFFMTFLSLKNDVNVPVPSKSNKKKNGSAILLISMKLYLIIILMLMQEQWWAAGWAHGLRYVRPADGGENLERRNHQTRLCRQLSKCSNRGCDSSYTKILVTCLWNWNEINVINIKLLVAFVS